MPLLQVIFEFLFFSRSLEMSIVTVLTVWYLLFAVECRYLQFNCTKLWFILHLDWFSTSEKYGIERSTWHSIRFDSTILIWISLMRQPSMDFFHISQVWHHCYNREMIGWHFFFLNKIQFVFITVIFIWFHRKRLFCLYFRSKIQFKRAVHLVYTIENKNGWNFSDIFLCCFKKKRIIVILLYLDACFCMEIRPNSREIERNMKIFIFN